MPDKMRARHEVFGVKDVLDNDFYRNSGWTPVAADTPTAEQERRSVVNAARRGDLNDRPAAEVAAVMPSLSDEDRETVVATEKASAKPRKTVINAAD